MTIIPRAVLAALILGLSASLSPAIADDAAAPASERRVEALKAEIFALAERFKGEGDPDFARQRQLNVLVAELIEANPQPPVVERLDLLAGVWHQVWGPYDYRSHDARGVDPATDPDRIYQVVFRDGFYINVSPRDVRDAGPTREVVLLRGAYRALYAPSDLLEARFVRFTKTEVASEDLDRLWPLAFSSASGTLYDDWILPGFLVRALFGGGGLREAYTDDTLRITYGAGDVEDRSTEFIYVMRRVGTAADGQSAAPQ